MGPHPLIYVYAAVVCGLAIVLAIGPVVVFTRRLSRPGPSDRTGKVLAIIALPVFIAGGVAAALFANQVSTMPDGSMHPPSLILFTLPCLIAAAVVSLGLKTLLKR